MQALEKVVGELNKLDIINQLLCEEKKDFKYLIGLERFL